MGAIHAIHFILSEASESLRERFATGLAVSHDSSLLASISNDEAVKIFDVRTLDMMAMLRLPFKPSCIEWIFKVRDKYSKLELDAQLLLYSLPIANSIPPSMNFGPIKLTKVRPGCGGSIS